MENRSFDHVLGWMRRSRPDIDGLTGRESNFLTKRDAWAGTFESYFSLRKTPGTDCPEKLPEVVKSLRPHGPKEDEALSSFQVELIQLISQLNGDHAVDTYPHIGMSMNVDQASKYAQDTVARFLEAGRNALRAGVNASSLLTIRRSLAALRSI